MKKNIFLFVLVIAALLLAGCGGATEKKQNQVTVGGKNFTEQQIMAEMTARIAPPASFCW